MSFARYSTITVIFYTNHCCFLSHIHYEQWHMFAFRSTTNSKNLPSGYVFRLFLGSSSIFFLRQHTFSRTLELLLLNIQLYPNRPNIVSFATRFRLLLKSSSVFESLCSTILDFSAATQHARILGYFKVANLKVHSFPFHTLPFSLQTSVFDVMSHDSSISL